MNKYDTLYDFDNEVKRISIAKAPTSTEEATPNAEEITPDYMKIARIKFILSLNDPLADNENLKKELLQITAKGNMTKFYEKLCTDLSWPIDRELLEKMKRENELELKAIEETEVDVDNPENEWKPKLDFFMKIGDFDEAFKLATEKCEDKSLSTNNRLEAAFALFRLAYSNGCDIKAMGAAVEKAKHFIDSNEHKADWSGRNKFKAYEGIYNLGIRDYKNAAKNFCDCISTFESYELTDFPTIVKFTVMSCMMALPRYEIKKKIINNGIVMQELNSDSKKYLKKFVLSLDYCHYSDFLEVLAIIEMELKFEPITFPHYQQYVRNMKLKAYSQLLQSYSTVSLKRMSEIFGVSDQYIEDDISNFIANGKLMCRIDKVAGNILTAYGGADIDRTILYQNSIKKGDMLLNRIKRLARIIET